MESDKTQQKFLAIKFHITTNSHKMFDFGAVLKGRQFKAVI